VTISARPSSSRDDGTKFEVAVGRFFLVPPKPAAK